MNNSVIITKKEFEKFLENNYWWMPYPEELYGHSLLGVKENGSLKEVEIETWEFCYFIPIIKNKIWLKIFSSISRNTNISRDYADDSIKIVPFSLEKFRPIMTKCSRIHRVKGWKKNFSKRIDDIAKRMGNRMSCLECGRNLNIKKNKYKTDIHFIGCKYPECKFSDGIKFYGNS